MSRVSRVILVAVLLVFAWMMLSGWETDPPKARAASAAVAAFMLLLAAGIAAPTRLRVALRLVAGIVALGYLAYFAAELRALLGGARQPLALGQPSAVMAGLGLLVIGVPALVYALGGVTTGWVDRLLGRMRGEDTSSDDRQHGP